MAYFYFSISLSAEPKFKSPSPQSVNITEGQDPLLECSAAGPPTPNVTWVEFKDGKKITISQGYGTVTLSLPNIKREQSGKYECHAINNPNQRPAAIQTNLQVMCK